MNYLILFTFILGFSSSVAHAKKCDLSSEQPESILKKAIGLKDQDSLPAPNTPVKELGGKNFILALAADAKARNCEYDTKGSYDTLGEIQASIRHHFNQLPPPPSTDDNIPYNPNHPFQMVIFPVITENAILLRLTENGFEFHVCGKDDKDFMDDAVYLGKHCAYLMPPGMYIPQHQMLHSLNGFGHVFKIFGKVFTQASVTIISTASLGLLSSVASAGATYLDPDSMTKIKNDFAVKKMLDQMLTLEKASLEDDDQNEHLLTEVAPYSFDELDQAVSDVLKDMTRIDFKESHPFEMQLHNPSRYNKIGYQMKKNVYTVSNVRYAKQVKDPTAAPAAPAEEINSKILLDWGEN